tara:strand:+ start:222 stop:488 length:267 start_codon:yes stop_codon:yes gene_type:complete
MINDESIYVVSLGPTRSRLRPYGFKVKTFSNDMHHCPVTAAENYIEGYVEGQNDYGEDDELLQLMHLSGKQLKELLQRLVELDAEEAS